MSTKTPKAGLGIQLMPQNKQQNQKQQENTPNMAVNKGSL